MKEVQEIRLTHGRGETVSNLLTCAIAVAYLFYAAKPAVRERHLSWARGQWEKLSYRASVWQAQAEIQSLPETDEPT